MKKYTLLFTFLLPFFLIAQSEKIDPIAIQILDGTSDIIGELESCSFEINSSTDFNDPDAGLIKLHKKSTVIFDGPNKMLVRSKGDKGDRGTWYNGEHMVYYSFTENNYVILEAPETTIETIDNVYINYGIEFPAADFFYPSFTDDIIEGFDTVKYLGKKIINNIECFHIKASNKKMDVQFWISNDIYRLPKKFVIIYKEENFKQHEATIDNWELNNEFPDSIFEFVPPANASEIKILAKNN